MLTKVDLAAMADAGEEPDKMVEEFLRQMRAELTEARHAAATSMADETRLRARCERHRSDAESWTRKAEVAVENGDDDLAREALLRKLKAQRVAANYEAQWSAEHDKVDELRSALARLEA